MLNPDLISDIEWEGIDYRDAPDFCDSCIVSFKYDGREPTQEEWNELDNDSELQYDLLMNHIY